jgi:hypothetical protein
MGRVVISRAVPFRRGDESISIFIDGKAMGTLLGDRSLSLEVAAGMHRLRPFVNGRRGKEFVLQVAEDETLQLQVHDPQQPPPKWWDWIPVFFIVFFPEHLLGKYGQIAMWGLWAVSLAVVILLQIPRMRKRPYVEAVPQEELAVMQ